MFRQDSAQGGGIPIKDMFEAEDAGEVPLGRQTAIASENALRKLWDTPEEDDAWRTL